MRQSQRNGIGVQQWIQSMNQTRRYMLSFLPGTRRQRMHRAQVRSNGSKCGRLLDEGSWRWNDKFWGEGPWFGFEPTVSLYCQRILFKLTQVGVL